MYNQKKMYIKKKRMIKHLICENSHLTLKITLNIKALTTMGGALCGCVFILNCNK